MADNEKTGPPGEVVETTASPNAAASLHDDDRHHNRQQDGVASRPESINVRMKQTPAIDCNGTRPLVAILHLHCTRNGYHWKITCETDRWIQLFLP
jgi:hypothetical protein